MGEGRIQLGLLDATPLANWPIYVGVPLGRGEISDENKVELFNKRNERVLLQTRVLNRWTDNSIKVLLLNFVSNQDSPYKLHYGEVTGKQPVTDLKVVDEVDRVRVENSHISFEVNKTKGLFLQNLKVDGVEVLTEPLSASVKAYKHRRWTLYSTVYAPPEEIVVEEKGPVRATIRIKGKHVAIDGDSCFLYDLRIRVFAHSRVIILYYTYLNREGEGDDEVTVKDISLNATLNIKPPQTEGMICDGAHIWRRVSEIGLAINDGPFPSAQTFSLADFHLTVGIKNLWKLYPKEISVRKDFFKVGIFPEGWRGGRWKMGFDQRGYWFERTGEMRVRRGTSQRTEVYLYLHGKDVDENELEMARQTIAEPPLVEPTNLESEAFGRILPHSPLLVPEVEEDLELRFESLLSTVDVYDMYGMIDYGDILTYDMRTVKENFRVWANGEHDGGFGILIQFLRTGKRKYFDFGEAVIRHMMNIDIRKEDPEVWYLHGHVAGHCAVPHGPGRGHTWLEGLILYYLLTGDEDSYECMCRMANWYKKVTNPETSWGTLREGGKGIWMMCALYEVLKDDELLSLSKGCVETLLPLFRPDGTISPYPFGGADPAFCDPHYRKSLHLYIMGVGLARYISLTSDKEAEKAFVNFVMASILDGDLLTDNGKGVFYQNMPTNRVGRRTAEEIAWARNTPGDVYTVAFLELLAWACKFSGNKRFLVKGEELLRAYLERNKDKPRRPGSFYPATSPMQHLPVFLKTLDEEGMLTQ